MDNPKPYIEDICSEYPKILELADGTLKTEDGYSFTIHKIALAKCSKYFFTLFCGPGKGQTEYLVPGIRGEVLSNILSYFYNEKLHVNEKNISDIIIASDYLLIDVLLSQMNTLLEKHLSVSNCLDIYQCMMQIGRRDFSKVCYRFIQMHFQEIVCNTDTDFSEWPLDILKQLLSDRNIRVEHEEIVWQAIVRWVESDLLNRLCKVPELLIYLRITDVDEKLATEILEHAIVEGNTFRRPITLSKTAKYKDLLESLQCSICADTEEFPFYIPRKPSILNFIASNYRYVSSGKFELYVTYDENIDLWRKILEVDQYPNYLVSLGDCIYLIETGNELKRYNVSEKKWMNFENLRHKRVRFAVASAGGFIYTIGGHLGADNTLRVFTVYYVEVYDPGKDSWRDTMSMLPNLNFPEAVTLNGIIYVAGPNLTETGISFQMYNPYTEVWNELPGLPFFRMLFALVSYEEKIYLIGGWSEYFESNIAKNVEVFDPSQTIWYSIAILPYAYTYPKAIVINDLLIVSEKPGSFSYSEKCNPPVRWNKDRESWETIEESSPYFNIHDYFLNIQEGNSINVISTENKKLTTVFEKSLFF